MEKDANKASSKGSKDKKPSKKEAAAQSKALSKEQKRKKQEQKALKKEKKKSVKKKGQNNNDDDVDDDVDDAEFEKLVSELLSKDVAHNTVTVEKLSSDPTPRASFTLCLAGNNYQDGIVLFGGEYFDGATSKCYDETLRMKLTQTNSREWKNILSPNSPPPRCAHATCTTPTHVYIFGGEFSTAWRFHHYNDLWRFDLKTNMWTNMPSLNGPSPRSGCRMVSWKNYLIVFGGFYEASRGVRWHEDLHIYDLKTEKWNRAKLAPNSQHPSARSGFQFICHPTKPLVYLYGGYSKIATSSTSTSKGRALDDMWILHLLAPANQKQQAFPDVKWEYLPKRGQSPSKRSGACSCVHKNRILLFGGTIDEETQNDVIGHFTNSLFAFDMDRQRWFELGLRGSSGGREGGKKGRRSKKDNATLPSSSTMSDQEDEEEEVVEEEEEESDEESSVFGLKDDAVYVIIDGKFVLVEEEDEDEEEKIENSSKTIETAMASTTLNDKEKKQENKQTVQKEEEEEKKSNNNKIEEEKPSKVVEKLPWNGLPAPEPRIASGMCVLNNRLYILGGTTEMGDIQITFDDIWFLDLNKMDAWIPLTNGTWKEQQWAGKNEDDEEEGESEDDDDDDDDEEGEDEDENSSSEEEEEEDENAENIRALTEEIKQIRDELGVNEDFKTPNANENLKTFFRRTANYWLEECAKVKRVDERLTGKDLRRFAFNLARRRFDLLSPLLEKLNALEEAQKAAEEEAAEEARALATKLAKKNAKKTLKKKQEKE